MVRRAGLARPVAEIARGSGTGAAEGWVLIQMRIRQGRLRGSGFLGGFHHDVCVGDS